MDILGPKDTISIVKNTNIENFYLKFQKFPKYRETGKRKGFYFYDRNKRGEVIYDITKNAKFTTYKDRHQASIETFLKHIQYKMDTLPYAVNWRLIVGLGGESVYETSMTLHHIYGFPYIPGQGLKGAIRNYVITTLFSADEEAALKDEGFVNIFGSQEREGSVFFFDAYPENPKLKVDVMNPHYGDYYQDETGTKPPADYYNPVPIFFLTVDKDVRFTFLFGSKNGIDNLFIHGKSLRGLIENTLKTHGVGAKTAVGYGYVKGV